MDNKVQISFKRKIFITIVLSFLPIIIITSFYLIIIHAFVYYKWGIMGHISDCVFRLFTIIVINLILAFDFYFNKVRNLLL